MKLETHVSEAIRQYATKIKGTGKADEHALGELQFYMALQRVITKKAKPADLGLMDAINDVLQAKGLVADGKTFLK
jgi:hypothetical protein